MNQMDPKLENRSKNRSSVWQIWLHPGSLNMTCFNFFLFLQNYVNCPYFGTSPSIFLKLGYCLLSKEKDTTDENSNKLRSEEGEVALTNDLFTTSLPSALIILLNMRIVVLLVWWGVYQVYPSANFLSGGRQFIILWFNSFPFHLHSALSIVANYGGAWLELGLTC